MQALNKGPLSGEEIAEAVSYFRKIELNDQNFQEVTRLMIEVSRHWDEVKYLSSLGIRLYSRDLLEADIYQKVARIKGIFMNSDFYKVF